MTAAATPTGMVVLGVALVLLVAQEFTRGFGTPPDAEVKDDRSALLYLEVLPVVLVTVALGLSLGGWAAWPAQWALFAVGMAVMGAGLALREWSHRTLGRFHQAVVTIQAEHEIVATGPYRLVRHPMYAGSAVTFLGLGVALGTVPALAVAFGGTLPAVLRRIVVEERALLAALGETYATYADGRSRLFPGIW